MYEYTNSSRTLTSSERLVVVRTLAIQEYFPQAISNAARAVAAAVARAAAPDPSLWAGRRSWAETGGTEWAQKRSTVAAATASAAVWATAPDSPSPPSSGWQASASANWSPYIAVSH